jgi:hypothetical protein
MAVGDVKTAEAPAPAAPITVVPVAAAAAVGRVTQLPLRPPSANSGLAAGVRVLSFVPFAEVAWGKARFTVPLALPKRCTSVEEAAAALALAEEADAEAGAAAAAAAAAAADVAVETDILPRCRRSAMAIMADAAAASAAANDGGDDKASAGPAGPENPAGRKGSWYTAPGQTLSKADKAAVKAGKAATQAGVSAAALGRVALPAGCSWDGVGATAAGVSTTLTLKKGPDVARAAAFAPLLIDEACDRIAAATVAATTAADTSLAPDAFAALSAALPAHNVFAAALAPVMVSAAAADEYARTHALPPPPPGAVTVHAPLTRLNFSELLHTVSAHTGVPAGVIKITHRGKMVKSDADLTAAVDAAAALRAKVNPAAAATPTVETTGFAGGLPAATEYRLPLLQLIVIGAAVGEPTAGPAVAEAAAAAAAVATVAAATVPAVVAPAPAPAQAPVLATTPGAAAAPAGASKRPVSAAKPTPAPAPGAATAAVGDVDMKPRFAGSGTTGTAPAATATVSAPVPASRTSQQGGMASAMRQLAAQRAAAFAAATSAPAIAAVTPVQAPVLTPSHPLLAPHDPAAEAARRVRLRPVTVKKAADDSDISSSDSELDGVLAELRAGKCGHKGCRSGLGIGGTGYPCVHCRREYCVEHRNPLFHGCEAAARAASRTAAATNAVAAAVRAADKPGWAGAGSSASAGAAGERARVQHAGSAAMRPLTDFERRKALAEAHERLDKKKNAGAGGGTKGKKDDKDKSKKK